MFGHTGGFAGRLPCAVLLEYIVFVLVGHGTPPEAHLAQVIARTGKKHTQNSQTKYSGVAKTRHTN